MSNKCSMKYILNESFQQQSQKFYIEIEGFLFLWNYPFQRDDKYKTKNLA